MSSHENNFLGLEADKAKFETAKAAVILAPLENTTSFQQGTRQGPAAFIRASQQVELYDHVTQKDYTDEVGVVTFPEPDLIGFSSEKALSIIQRDVEQALEGGLWPITVGGEHTISLAPVRALQKRYSNLSVLQIDAHADLRDTYEGSPFSHASVIRRIFDLGVPTVGVGIRNYSKEEALFIKKNSIQIFHDHEIRKHGIRPELVSKTLSPKVYVTIDVDGFSPSECPGTGTPEPGGLSWWDALELFSYVFKKFDVVGMDINEIMPIPGSQRTEFFAAKLAYKLLGMKFFSSQS